MKTGLVTGLTMKIVLETLRQIFSMMLLHSNAKLFYPSTTVSLLI
jgi:hypothetical protein